MTPKIGKLRRTLSMTKTIILILLSTTLLIGCGFNSKEFNDNLSRNKFIGVEPMKDLKKIDPDIVEGLCNGLTESQLENKSNHNLILNKNMICVVNKVNKSKGA
jgi:PBP1b-binding outer membrane lipoprotein LpoB